MEEQYFTIILQNANVASFRTINDPQDNSPSKPREEVSFTYQKIIWTWEAGGITAEDDWETPVQ